MQPHVPAPVPLHRRPALFLWLLLLAALPAHAVKTHTVTLGPARRVPYTPPEATRESKAEDSTTLKVRSLDVDGMHREWTVGDGHDVTDRSFTIRRALRLNDALPGEVPRWTWQPGPWLLVDRVSGRVTALHLPAFDAEVSDVVWFRDYAAYCGILTTAKGGLVAVVAQLGGRKAVAQRVISKWPLPDAPHPACAPAHWSRAPIRVALTPAGGEPVTFDIVGTSSLVEEGEGGDEP